MQAISTAVGGLQRAESLLNQAASRLAQSPFSSSTHEDQISLSDEATSLLAAQNDYQSNLDTIKVANEMQKSGLSLLA
jgi:flagellar hook protein FlgE